MSDAEDEDLETLRAAALASLKSRTDDSTSTSTETNHIAAINTVASTSNYAPYPGSYNASEQSSYSNQHNWRNSAQAGRRNRGNSRSFPKVSQRSNLIVITPVTTEDKISEEKGSMPQLVLPQHKWCQSANEDSSSPKTFRRTGPTRFNRLESGSESSDSEYENSENDSYSNETILQDEPSDHFAGRSGESVGHLSSPEKPMSERRLSFQNIDSDLNLDSFQNNESTSVYKCLKTTYPNKPSEERPLMLRSPSLENDSEQSWKHESRGNYFRHENAVESKLPEQENHLYSTDTRTVNGGSSMKHKLLSVLSPETDSSRIPRRSEVPQNNGSHSDLNFKTNHSNSDQTKLPENDLRLELKKRLREYQSEKDLSKKKSASSDSRSTSRSRSRERSYFRSSRSRDHSEGKNYAHGSSSSQKNNRSRSRSENERYSQSPRRNHSSRLSRSPEKQHRHKLDRRRRKDHSRSPVRNHKRKRSRSTQRNNKRDYDSSQDFNRDRNLSKDRKPSGRRRYRSRSSSSSSSSSTSSSNSSSDLPMRSISSVIKPVQPKDNAVKHEKDSASHKNRTSSPESDARRCPPKKNQKLDENNSVASVIKSSVHSGDNKTNASDGNKRVPVHMRLGSLSGKRVIQMTKDVEAAFVNTSSDDADEEANFKHKKDNFRVGVVYDINDSKSDESSKRHFQQNSLRSMDTPKDRRLKHHR